MLKCAIDEDDREDCLHVEAREALRSSISKQEKESNSGTESRVARVAANRLLYLF